VKHRLPFIGIHLFVLLLVPFTLSRAQARSIGTHFVTVPVLEERSTPNGPVVNRIYQGQKVDVTDLRAGWARVTGRRYEARWVRASALSVNRPKEPAQRGQPADVKDPRIAKDAIPRVGEGGLTQRDVDLLWRGAAHMLKTKRCSEIAYAGKSTSRPGMYYVNCGGPRNIFFTRADIE
jgi:hypothetical protein